MTDLAADIVATTRHPLLVLDDALRVKLANPAFCTTFAISREQVEGKPVAGLGRGELDIPELRRLLSELLDGGPEVTDYRVEQDTGEAGLRVTLVSARRMAHDDGAILVAFEDITDREQAVDALRACEQRLKNVLELEGVGVLFFDEGSGALLDANDAFLKMSGYSRQEVDSGSLTWRDMTPPEWVEVSEEQLVKLGSTGFIGPYEKEYLNKDGSRSWMVFTGRTLGDGTVVEYCFDVSDHVRERNAVEQQRELLLSELSHRVKNSLAVVQGMASQTMARSESLEEFEAAFQGRLDALARGHNQLVRAEWKPADMGEVVTGAVGALHEDGRVSAIGPAVHLTTRKVISLNLVLHELGTNATKYGALSGEGGRVDISWSQDGDRTVRMVWRETDGPPVTPPNHDGFGTRLIRQLVAYELDGDARLDFDPDGLRAEITFPTLEESFSAHHVPPTGRG